MPAATQAENGVDTIPVQLTRMEGDLKLILFQVTDVSRRVGTLEGEMTLQRSATQQLQSDARAAERAVKDADRAREDTAAALEKQNALALAKAKDAVDSATRAWAPRNFAIAAAALFIAALAAYAAFKYGGGNYATPTK